MVDEHKVIIDGTELTTAQVVTIRVALANFTSDLKHNGLGDDNHGKTMTNLYLERISEIIPLLF